jgi:hypothetical protein
VDFNADVGPGDELSAAVAASTGLPQTATARVATLAPPVGPAPSSQRVDPAAAAGRARWDNTSFDSGESHERVAATFGRTAVEAAPLDAGAPHAHAAAAGGGMPEARAPAVTLSGVAPAGSLELQGWDGGEFWFGPNGLVRVREAGQ